MPTFPTLSRGASIQYPNGEDDVITSVADYLDSGVGTFRCTSAFVDNSGVTHLATQKRFRLTFSSISAADVAILETFFRDTVRGRLGIFSFTDDDGVVWPKCTFDQDALEIRYIQKNQYATDLNVLAITNLDIPALPGVGLSPNGVGAQLFAAPGTWTATWEDQLGGGDGNFANGTTRIVIDNAGNATIEYLGTLGSTFFHNYFGVNNTKLVDSGTPGPVSIGTYTAGQEVILQIFVNGNTTTNWVFFSGPGSRNPDGLVHCKLVNG